MLRWHRAALLVAIAALATNLCACEPVPFDERIEVHVVDEQPVPIDMRCATGKCGGVTLELKYAETYAPEERVAFQQYRVDFALPGTDDPPYYADRNAFEIEPGEMMFRPLTLAGSAQRDALIEEALRRPIPGTATITLAGYTHDDERVFLIVDLDVEVHAQDGHGDAGAGR